MSEVLKFLVALLIGYGVAYIHRQIKLRKAKKKLTENLEIQKEYYKRGEQ